MSKIKALEILKKIRTNKSLLVKCAIEDLSVKQLDEAIEQLELEETKSCNNCVFYTEDYYHVFSCEHEDLILDMGDHTKYFCSEPDFYCKYFKPKSID